MVLRGDGMLRYTNRAALHGTGSTFIMYGWGVSPGGVFKCRFRSQINTINNSTRISQRVALHAGPSDIGTVGSTDL